MNRSQLHIASSVRSGTSGAAGAHDVTRECEAET